MVTDNGCCKEERFRQADVQPARSFLAVTGDELPIRAERAPYGAPAPCLGASTGFFSSPNHLRIFLAKLLMRRSYARAVVSPIEMPNPPSS